MASRNVMLPVIDFCSQELKPGTSTWESVKAEVRRTLEEFGCFHALYDKIPSETCKKMLDWLPEFFDRPSQEIEENSPNELVKYFGRDGESIGITGIIEPGKINSFITSIWPSGNTTFCETIQCYFELLLNLDRTIRTMILESLGLERYMEEQVKNIKFRSIFNKYPPPQTNGDELLLPSHTDKGLVTILDENGRGLEIMTKDDQWVKVNFTRNSLFALLGDSFHAWTNGRLHQPHHRVILKKDEERYSIGFFPLYRDGYMVKPPEELIDENHPQLYNPFDISGLLAFYHDDGYKYHSTLKEYCGV